VKPDYEAKTTEGFVTITLRAKNNAGRIQVDLQQPLEIDSFSVNGVMQENKDGLAHSFEAANVWYLSVKELRLNTAQQVTIYYHGKPREAVKPPWDGGWIWKKDKLGRPWMSVACQGLGASVWYPCKDHQSDEPDNGASLSVIVPDTLVAVGNGRLTSTQKNNDGTTTYKWEVKNPINNYNIIPYIGKYVNWSDTLRGEKGTLDLNYWVLDYNLDTAKKTISAGKTNFTFT
jgi:aminopeptidase N